MLVWSCTVTGKTGVNSLMHIHVQWQHCVVAMVVFSEYVLRHISHDGSVIRLYILLWSSRKQNEYRVHLENQFLHLSFRSCTFSYSLPKDKCKNWSSMHILA